MAIIDGYACGPDERRALMLLTADVATLLQVCVCVCVCVRVCMRFAP